MKFKISPELIEDVRITAQTEEIFRDIMTVYTPLKLRHRGNVLPLNRLHLWGIHKEATVVGFYYGSISVGDVSSALCRNRRVMSLEQFVANFVDMSPDKPEDGQDYWYIDIARRVSRKAVWSSSEIDNLRLDFCNVFDRRKDALKKLESL